MIPSIKHHSNTNRPIPTIKRILQNTLQAINYLLIIKHIFSSIILFVLTKLIFSQQMNKNKDIILENPFHPLDLTPHDLLAIYKRFEQSRLINRNPKQQLPIQVIAQLISSLKGCPPSYVQKCISQALIKQTISWNEFLTFLDQESQVREKILEWLMYQKTLIKYKEEKEWPIRSKINTFFEEINFLKFIELNQNERYILCSIDNVGFYLFSEMNGKLGIIDCYKNKSERIYEQKPRQQEEGVKMESKIFMKNQSKMKKQVHSYVSKSSNKSERKDVDKTMKSILSSAPRMAPSIRDEQDEQVYFKKERKNINSLFNIWKELNLDGSIAYSKAVASKLSEKNINQNQVGQIRQLYSGMNEEKGKEKKVTTGSYGLKPIQKAHILLKDLHRQKRVLSYNPYASYKSNGQSDVEMKFRKATKQRKARDYTHESSKQAYSSELRCLAVIYFNMEVSLVKLVKEFNKVSLEEQDKIRILTESEHKKNEIIEGVDFYHHSIVDKWFLIVLVRVEYKNQMRNENESYIRGYQIDLVENKRRNDKDYKFNSKKQTFSFSLCNPNGRRDEISKNQVFRMSMQKQYGIHFITVNGKYISIKEDYIQKTGCSMFPAKNQSTYFTFRYQQRFKNAGLSLSCLSVGIELNKIVFGTIRGMIIIYDMFSHYFKIKKVTNCQIVQLKVIESLVYILTLDEKLFIMDLVKLEEVQHLSVKNDNKLHEKIKHFEMFRNVLYLYGTEMRSYVRFVNEEIQHERRKMQTIYKWRLDRLFKEEASYTKAHKYDEKAISKYMPHNTVKDSSATNIQIVLTSETYFLVLTDILELIVIEKATLKIKFTIIMAIPHDSKVMKMVLGPNEKLLALLLFNQNIYVFNIHTQDQYQLIKPTPFHKYTALTFLDLKNQYLLANGTECGKIILTPYSSIPEKKEKMLPFHKKNISSMVVVRKECLVCSGQDNKISIWLLPFNILKHQIKIKPQLGCPVAQVGIFKECVYLKTLQGIILEVNSHQGKLSQVIQKGSSWTCSRVDSCTGQMFGVNRTNRLERFVESKKEWEKKGQFKIDVMRSEVKEVTVIESQKVILFLQSGVMLPWSYQNQKFGKTIALYQQ